MSRLPEGTKLEQSEREIIFDRAYDRGYQRHHLSRENNKIKR